MKLRPIVNALFLCGLFVVFSVPINATVVFSYGDRRAVSVATLLAYEFLNDNTFYHCAEGWLEGRSSAACDAYRDRIYGIAASEKNLSFSSVADEKFIEVLTMYKAASDAAAPYCPNWYRGERPDICFKLILRSVCKAKKIFQKEVPIDPITGQKVKPRPCG